MKMYKTKDGSYINLNQIGSLEIRESWNKLLGGKICAIACYCNNCYELYSKEQTIQEICRAEEQESKVERLRMRLINNVEEWLDNFVKEYMS